MRIAIAAVSSFVLALATLSSEAVEGGAVTIDTLSIDAFASSVSDVAGVSLVSEVTSLAPPLHWTILAGLNYRDISLDNDYEDESFGGLLGTRYYVTRQTSLDLYGTFDQMDIWGFEDVASLTFGAKQTLATPRSGVTPYLFGTSALRFKDHRPGSDTQESNDSDVMFTLGAGADFMLTHTLAMGFQYEYIGITDSPTSSDYEDASHISVSFKGYWDYLGAYDPRN